MDELIVTGPTPLRGAARVYGAKNSVTKLLTASMLTSAPCTITNVPYIGDLEITAEICTALGADIGQPSPRALETRTGEIRTTEVPSRLARRNRLAVLMLAPLLHRVGAARIPVAGGDRIGPRPVDFHLDGYRALGADVRVEDGVYCLEADGLIGADITLPYPSVTTTENLIMAASLARGTTVLRNAAVEPEVLDLVLFLQKMGAVIDPRQDRTYVIEGVPSLTGASHRVIPDRLVAASLAAAAVATGGEIFVEGARQADLLAFLNALRRIGADLDVAEDGITFRRSGPLRPVAIETTVHPGLMTDWQPPLAVVLTQADGVSVIHETVFEDRFVYVGALTRMGARIELVDDCLGPSECRFRACCHKHSAVIHGPTALRAAEIEIPDLRAGFTHLIAAAVATGRSRLRGVEQIDRGYEHIEETLRDLGADIERRSADGSPAVRRDPPACWRRAGGGSHPLSARPGGATFRS